VITVKRLIIILFLMMLVGTVGATNYFGNNPSAPTTTAGRNPVYVPVAGTITKVEIYDYSGTAGSAELYQYFIRVNNAVDYRIANQSVSANERVFSNTALNIAVNAGDYFEIKRIQPTWATNPATNIVGGYVYVETATPGYVLWGQGLTNAPGDNALNYFGNKPGAPITTDGRSKIYVPANGTVTRVDAREYSGTAGTAETYGYRIRKNTDTPVFVQNQTLNTNLRVFTNPSLNVPVLTTDYLEFTRVHPNWSTNPATNIVGATAFVDTSLSSTLAGYPINVQALTSSPVDAQTVYFGTLPKAPTTTAAISKVYIRQSGIIKNAEIYTYSGTAGSNQAWSLYLRKNNTEDFLIKTVGVAAAERRFNNNALNIPVVAGDYIEIKGVQPTWTTNPATTIYGGYIWLEYGVATTPQDTTPPASITGLNNDTTGVYTINWSWMNPLDNDFNGTMIYQNDTWMKNVSKTTTYDNWSELVEGTPYTISTRTFDTTGNVNQTWVNKTETTLFSGNEPVGVTVYSGEHPINDTLSQITEPSVRSQVIAESVYSSVLNSVPAPKGDQPGTIEYTDELGQDIIIKQIDLVTDNAKVGYWILATRNGEEVHTHSPIWVVNSPYTVQDSESYNPRTNERTVVVREDPLAASKQVLSGYVSRQPLGKAQGDDVLMYYTAGNQDGRIYHYVVPGLSFTAMRNAAGNYVTTNAVSNNIGLYADTSSNNYSYFIRGYFEFNTSALPDDCAVNSAIVGIYGHTTLNTNLGIPTWGITRFVPATNGTAAAGDYDSFNNDWLSDTKIATDSWSVIAYNNFTLNALGLSNISKTSWTNYMFRNSWDINNDTTGLVWGNGYAAYAPVQFVEHGDTGIPFIEITYTPAAGGSAPVASFTTAKTLYRIPGILQVNDTSTNTPTGWNWSWGDGTWTNGTTQNATHKYTTRGTKSILLVTSNAFGSNTTPTATTVRIVGYENYW
jgi:PKD repeat protein